LKQKQQRLLALLQGTYFLVTGLWPILHMNSFIAVTGPKESLWLVITVGALITVTGLVLLLAAARGNISPEVFLLAVGNAVGLAVVEIVYVIDGTIPLIYLLDTAIEVVLVLAWFRTLTLREPARQPSPVGPPAEPG
jgi:hypothetical protein